VAVLALHRARLGERHALHHAAELRVLHLPRDHPAHARLHGVRHPVVAREAAHTHGHAGHRRGRVGALTDHAVDVDLAGGGEVRRVADHGLRALARLQARQVLRAGALGGLFVGEARLEVVPRGDLLELALLLDLVGEELPHVRGDVGVGRRFGLFAQIVLEGDLHLLTGLEAGPGLLLEGLHDDVFQTLRDARRHLGRRHHAAFGDHLQDHQLGLVLEEPLPGAELVEHDAQREDVAALIDRSAQTLLGAHVAELALQHAGLGVFGLGGRLGDAEVDDLHLALVGHEDVLGRNVAVHDLQGLAVRTPEVVGVVERLAGVGDDARGEHGRTAGSPLDAAPGDRREVFAGDELHRDEVGLVGLAAEVVDLDDVRVVEGRAHAGLVQEHLDEGLLLREVAQDLLDDDEAVEAGHAGLAGEPDLRHAAGRQLLDERVPAEPADRADVRVERRLLRGALILGHVNHWPRSS
jgi:hypothetical protein